MITEVVVAGEGRERAAHRERSSCAAEAKLRSISALESLPLRGLGCPGVALVPYPTLLMGTIIGMATARDRKTLADVSKTLPGLRPYPADCEVSVPAT